VAAVGPQQAGLVTDVVGMRPDPARVAAVDLARLPTQAVHMVVSLEEMFREEVEAGMDFVVLVERHQIEDEVDAVAVEGKQAISRVDCYQVEDEVVMGMVDFGNLTVVVKVPVVASARIRATVNMEGEEDISRCTRAARTTGYGPRLETGKRTGAACRSEPQSVHSCCLSRRCLYLGRQHKVTTSLE
jgi:hypothetical protein